MQLISLGIGLLVMIISVGRGFRRGISGEIKALVSVIIATISLVLILLLYRAAKEHTYGTVMIVGGALVIISIGWKLVRTILSPLSGFRALSPVKAIDSLLGAIAGAIEGGAFIWIAMKIYEIYIQSNV